MTVPKEPRLWTADARASWRRVGRLVDAQGICQTIMVQLTGGVFLTGLALALGAGDLVVGVLAALPFAAKVSQLILSWWVERAGHWRESAVLGAWVGRALMLVVAGIGIVHPPGAIALGVLVLTMALSSLAASLFDLSYQTWMAEIIPEPLRGVFWGKRGQIAGAAGIVMSLAAGSLIDLVHTSLVAYAVVFAVASVVGCFGVFFLRQVPAPRRRRSRLEGEGLRRALLRPLRDANYRRLLVFSGCWSFLAGAMAPFYVVYMLRELHLPVIAVTALLSLSNVVLSISQPRWGSLGDRFGNKPVLRISSYLIVFATLFWFASAPGHAWPIILVQAIGGIGWSAFHVSQTNWILKLAPENERPSYLAAFGAIGGLAEGLAPIVGGALLVFLQSRGIGSFASYRFMIAGQAVALAAATWLPSVIREPGGVAVGHLIRVMARFYSIEGSGPVASVLQFGYTHLARVADVLARDYPHDAEPL